MTDEHNSAEPTRFESTEGVEYRSLSGQLAATALEGVVGTVAVLGTKDAYGKVKGALQSKDAESPIVLPPGTNLDD